MRSGNKKLFRKMFKDGTLVRTDVPGIYYVKRLTNLPFQIVITSELKGDEYAAYRILTKHANEKDVITVARAGVDDPILRDLSKKLLEFVDTKNPNIIQNITGGEIEMGRTLMEIMKPQIDEKIRIVVDTTRRNDLFDYVLAGDMLLDKAAKHAGLTPEQFKLEMEKYEASKKDIQIV